MTEVEYAKRIVGIAKLQGQQIGEVERAAGMHTGYLSRVISGKGRISFNTAQRLADEIGYSLPAVITRDIVKEAKEAEIRKMIGEYQSLIDKLKTELGSEGK